MQENGLFIQFHQLSNDKIILVPVRSVKYIIAHDDGGSMIYTHLTIANSDKLRSFHAKESAEQIFKSIQKDIRLSDGIFSQL